MLTGRFQLAAPGTKLPTQDGRGPRRSGPRSTAPRGRRRAAGRRARPGCPADDAAVEVRYRDPTQMGKVYLLPAGVDRPCPGWATDEIGPDADDPDLTLEAWRERIRRHPGELKNLLRNQAFVAGIGNAYSDEILHAARLLPFRKRSTLAAEEVDALYDGDAHDARATRSTSCASAFRRRSRRRSATSWRSTTRAASLPALRDADHRGQARRLRDVVLPRLPALEARARPRGRTKRSRLGQIKDLADPDPRGRRYC